MGSIATTSVPTGATLATTISYLNSNTTLIKNAVEGSLEGRGAATPNLADKTVEQDTVAYNASICVWSAEAGFSGFVVSGLTYASASGLTATFNAGTAWVLRTSSDPDQLRRVVASSSLTILLTASSDNYVYLKTDGTLGVATTTVGGSAPTIPADTLLLANATTNGTTVTGTPVDKRTLTASAVSKHYRSSGLWPVPSSTTNFRLPPGAVEINGSLFQTTANNDLDIATAGNFISGARTSNVWTYYVAANNGGALKVGLTTSAPSAMTVIAGATAGSVGRLQYRTIAGLPYRYLGAVRTSTTGVMKMFSRSGNRTSLHKQVAALSGGTSSSFTSVAFAATIPPTSRMVVIGVYGIPSTAEAATSLRENGTSAAGTPVTGGYQTSGVRSGGRDIMCPTSSSQKIDYKVVDGNANIDALGWVEDLD